MAARCPKCNQYLKKTSGNKEITSEELANEVTEYFNQCPATSEFVIKVAVPGTVLCINCYTKFKFWKSMKLKNEIKEQERIEREQKLIDNFSQSSISSSASSQPTSSSQASSAGDPTEKYNPAPEKEDLVELPIRRTISTHKYCFLCGSTKESLLVVPFQARLRVFIQTQIFIPKGD